jgi:hypothetical protein
LPEAVECVCHDAAGSALMGTTPTSLQVKGLDRQKMAALANKAKRLGMTTERYVRALVEEDLALDERAQATDLAQLLGPGRAIDEAELGRLVEAARKRQHERASRKR